MKTLCSLALAGVMLLGQALTAQAHLSAAPLLPSGFHGPSSASGAAGF